MERKCSGKSSRGQMAEEKVEFGMVEGVVAAAGIVFAGGSAAVDSKG